MNRATHDYPAATPARLHGWRRTWVRTDIRDVVFLSVRPDPTATIDGLVAQVPGADWTALDLRESGYDRVDATHAVSVPAPSVAVYQVPETMQRRGGQHSILLSYLDVVVQGFLREFGQKGVEAFFETTEGWDTPVQDDRGAPRYSRTQRLTAKERALVDRLLAQVQ
ncbi:MAG: gamma-glutamylcyclotransferase family protein [Pseudomonadota bacterium]